MHDDVLVLCVCVEGGGGGGGGGGGVQWLLVYDTCRMCVLKCTCCDNLYAVLT